jgi:putative DNA methylase
MIESTLQKGATDLNHYTLQAYAIMTNHVHILITPQVPLSATMKGIKGVTARNANKLLNRTVKVFWQDESFDHWTRDEAEEKKICRYIENNPGKSPPGSEPRRLALWSSAKK